MKRLPAVAIAMLSMFVLTGGNCSRARVESLTQMNEGVTKAQQKAYVDAVKALEHATAIDPTNDQAFYNLALVHIELQSFDAAREDLNRAIATNPQIAGYYEKLGTVQVQLEDWVGAKSSFEQALAVDPNLFKAYYKLAQVEEQLEDYQNALQHFTNAIETGPRFLEAYSELGRLYAEQGYLAESAQVLQSGLQVAMPGTEEEAMAHYLLGTVYQEQGSADMAIEEFRAALAVVGGMRDALFSLGWTYAEQGNNEEARRYLKKYVDSAGDAAPAHYVQAAREKLSGLEAGL